MATRTWSGQTLRFPGEEHSPTWAKGAGAIMSSDADRDIRFYTDNIRTFIEVAELGGIGRAARSLGMSQPSVSQQLGRLEASIGRRLFERGKDGVSLTPDGAVLFRHARSMVAINEAIARSFGVNGRKVRLSVGMSEMFSLTKIHRVLWLVAKQNPDLALRIVLDRTEMLQKRYEAGDFDIVVAGPLEPPPAARFLRSERLVWIGKPNHDLPAPDPVPLILPLDPSRLRTVMIEALEREGRSWTGLVEVSSVSLAEAAIEAGFGYCAAFESLPLREATHVDARSGLPELPSLDYYLHTPRGRRSDVVSAFCELVIEAAE